MAILLQEGLRDTGIDVIGKVPWGTHFCQFYDSKDDLIAILVPYFKAGLENNEFCMWVTCEPLNEDEALAALRATLPDLDRYLAAGQLEVMGHRDWYLKGGTFESQRVLAGWVEKLEQARAKGYDGLRLTGNTFWLEQSAWADFADYEEAVNDVIGRYRMIAICTYCLSRCGAPEIMDVIKNHQFALIRRGSRWETVESAEHRRLGEALLASEERFRRIVDTAAEGIWIVDRELATTFVNARLAEMLGYAEEEMLGRSWSSFTDELGPIAGDGNSSEGARRRDVKLRRKDGSALWALVSTTSLFDREGRSAGVLHMIADITERKEMERRLVEANDELQVQAEELAAQAEELRLSNESLLEAQRALQRSEERYRWLFERMAEGFALHEIICGPDGAPCDYRFLAVNPAFERITGLPQEAILGKTVREVLPGIEDHWINTYGEVALTGKPVRFENYAAPLDSYFEVIAFSPERGQFATLFVDISERKRAEQERERLLRQEEEFLSIAAHELRSPTTSMKGFAQLLIRRAQRLPNGAEWLPHLTMIDRQADRMTELIERLLDVSRIQLGRLELQREPLDLVSLASEAAAEAQMATDKHTIVVRAAVPSLNGLWEGSRLRQVLANLLSNAIQYSPRGGQIEVGVMQQDGEALVSVRDEGSGISAEAQAALFERYYRGDEAVQARPLGMGLGLFICHGVVAAHGGRIWVESKPGKGSTFFFTLPL